MLKNDNFLEENKYIFKKYKTIKQIWYGIIRNVYSVIRITDNLPFAMKTEIINGESKTLESEAYYLFELQGGIGIPKFISYGHIKKYNILIEELLDKSLYDIYIEKGKKCELEDACLIGLQILDRLEYIHSKNLIYRDIKPENFLIGINNPNIIYIIDFGFCKKYRSSKTGKHILPKNVGTITGTLKYLSPNVIRCKESSRRDDLISLGYLLIYLLKRTLPWLEKLNNIKELDKENYYYLIYSKETNGKGTLFKNIPTELVEYIKYTRNLKFEQNPDYSYLRSLFNNILLKKNLFYNKNVNFSWINDKNMSTSHKNFEVNKNNFHNRLYRNIKEKSKQRQYKEVNSVINEHNDFSKYLETFPNLVKKRGNNISLKKIDNIEKGFISDNIEHKKNIKKEIMKINDSKYNLIKSKLKKHSNNISKKNSKEIINLNNTCKFSINKINSNINVHNFIKNTNYSDIFNNIKKEKTFKEDISEILFSKDINYKSPFNKTWGKKHNHLKYKKNLHNIIYINKGNTINTYINDIPYRRINTLKNKKDLNKIVFNNNIRYISNTEKIKNKYIKNYESFL